MLRRSASAEADAPTSTAATVAVGLAVSAVTPQSSFAESVTTIAPHHSKDVFAFRLGTMSGRLHWAQALSA
jgi:hypothetical protein